jgi:hypothetical protein
VCAALTLPPAARTQAYLDRMQTRLKRMSSFLFRFQIHHGRRGKSDQQGRDHNRMNENALSEEHNQSAPATDAQDAGTEADTEGYADGEGDGETEHGAPPMDVPADSMNDDTAQSGLTTATTAKTHLSAPGRSE